VVALDRELPFAFHGEASFFEKAGAPAGTERRVAGILSTEEEDQQGETVIQKGIDFGYFLEKGFFNEHHDKSIKGIIGYPEMVVPFRKGAELPDGSTAKANLTWVEGHLLKGARATDVWEKALELQGTPRRLGFSVEGKSRLRSEDERTILKSMVRHAAITHMPVNAGAGLHAFAKAFEAAASADPDAIERAWIVFEKALTIGDAEVIITPAGPAIGEGSARILSVRDEPRAGKRRKKKVISKAEALEYVLKRVPGLSIEKAVQTVEVILERSRRRIS
jgi:hypothetical protein